MIKLQVIKTEKNADYDEEMKRWEETFGRNGMIRTNRIDDYRRDEESPQLEKTDKILQVAITDAQWEAIRKTVLEKF